MNIDDLRGKARPDQFAIAAKYAGVSPDVFEGMWRTESSNGTNMLSPAGAQGHFGIMPATRRTWENRTGTVINPNDFTDSLFVAANQMRENMASTRGNVDDALRMYNAGPDRSNWNNKETNAYAAKVRGSDPHADRVAQAATMAGHPLNTDDLKTMDTTSILNTAPEDIAVAQRPGQVHMPKHMNVEQVVAAALTGPDYKDIAPGNHAAIQDAQSREAGDGMEKSMTDAIPMWQKTAHALADVSLFAGAVKALSRDHPDADPAFMKAYADHWQETEKFAENEEEAAWMRDATSASDLDRIKGDIVERRNHRAVYARTPQDGLVYGGLASVLDPGGLALGFGFGKALEVAGVGSHVLMAGRAARVAEDAREVGVVGKGLEFIDGEFRPAPKRVQVPFSDPAGQFVAGDWVPVTKTLKAVTAREAVAPNLAAGLASLSVEGAGVNVLSDAALQASGEHKTIRDYAADGALGLALAGIVAPFHIGSARDTHLENIAENIRRNAIDADAKRHFEVQQDLGPNATSDEIAAEVTKRDAADIRDHIRTSLAPVPEQHRFLSTEGEGDQAFIVSDPVKLQDIHDRYDMGAVSDPLERKVVSELIARSEAMVADNPMNAKQMAATKTVLAKAKFGGDRGMESTGLTLLSSESPVSRSVGMMLLEGTTGAGGRRRTAAMAQVVRERLYNRHMAGYDGLYNVFRKENGRHIGLEAWDGKVRNEFNRGVAMEIEARNLAPGEARLEPYPHEAISKAADLWEKGMDHMRVEQQHVGTVGSARLGTSSVGYFTHKMDPRAVAALTDDEARQVRSILSDQFVDPANGFDRKFSNKLAAKYLETAADKRYGGAPVPVNLHSPEAADFIRDSLKALGHEAGDVDKLMDKFSRGGASHTKKRLRLNMSSDIGGGKQLIDLFNTDITALYRGYARRTSGEVALAQYGIMGKKGLDVMRRALIQSKSTVGEVEAFDQIASELLNTPFGEHNHKYMDNARIATSLSRLGGMGFTQFGEYANGMVAVGVHRTFAAMGGFNRLRKEVGQIAHGGNSTSAILGSIDKLGGHIGLDEYNLTRLFDVPDNDIKMYGTEQVGVFSRGLRAGAHLQATLSGHRMITAVQTRGMAEQVVHKMVAYARSGAEDAALRDMGISAELQAKIGKDLPNIAEFDAKGNLTKLDMAKSKMDDSDIMEMRDSIERGASQIIQRTYTGETGKWAHDGFLKLLFQFRTFSIISVEKQWGRNVRNYGALKSAMYLAGAMSFALPIHMARVQAKTMGMSRAAKDKYVKENMGVGSLVRATMNYASASGLLGDIMDVGVGATSSWFGNDGKDFADTVGGRGQGQKKLIGGVLAPGVAQVEDVWAGVHGDPHKLIRALPFSNTPWMQPLVNFTTPDPTN